MALNHPIFQDNPLSGEISLSTGAAPTPYHVYDGEGLLIFGSVDFDMLQLMIADESVFPVKTASGAAAAGFIMANFEDASMGAHHELQFFVLVSEKEGEVLAASPFALPIAMGTRHDWGTLCLNLWNDSDAVIAYNNEYLGLNARSARFSLFDKKPDGCLDYNVNDQLGVTIIQGSVRLQKTTRFSAIWNMSRIAGFRQIMKLGNADYACGHVINRKSPVLPQNRAARIFTSSDHAVTRLWNPKTDQLVIEEPSLSDIGFVPSSLQHMWPFRFVYRHPDDVG